MKLGLVSRRECWTLSLRGKLLILSLSVIVAFGTGWEAYPFLSVNHPVNGDLLIVEGWIPEHTLNQAAEEFQRGHYRSLVIINNVYDVENDDKASMLVEYGVPRQLINTISNRAVQRDRTYHAALAVKYWLLEKGISEKTFTVATLGPHARRSRLMYEKAFGNTAHVGIVAFDDQSYDPAHWWRTSEGARDVLGEAIAYTYSKCFSAWN
jgi:hypothetical protein